MDTNDVDQRDQHVTYLIDLVRWNFRTNTPNVTLITPEETMLMGHQYRSLQHFLLAWFDKMADLITDILVTK